MVFIEVGLVLYITTLIVIARVKSKRVAKEISKEYI